MRLDTDETGLAEEESDANAFSSLLWGASFLQQLYCKAYRRLADKEQQYTRDTVTKRVFAAAELHTRRQEELCAALLEYIHSQSEAGRFRQVAVVQQAAYDETRLTMRVRWPGEQAHLDKEVTKVFVVQASTAVLLEIVSSQCESSAESRFLCLRLNNSPALRASTSTSGEATHQVLKSCVPKLEPKRWGYEHHIVMAETDSAGGNLRAEAIGLSELHDAPLHLHNMCMAHRLHGVCLKTWPLAASCITGMIHSALILREAHAMRALRKAIGKIIAERLIIVESDQPPREEAQYFRRHMLSLFCPDARRQPKRAALFRFLAKRLLNGDWRRRDQLEHRCLGKECCENREMAVAKITRLAAKLWTSAKPSCFSKSNWLSWTEGCSFFGMGSAVHGLLPQSFLEAFGQGVALQGSEDAGHVPPALPLAPASFLEDDQQVAERLRKERANSCQQAVYFMSRKSIHHAELILMMQALEPEKGAMAHLLHHISADGLAEMCYARTQGEQPASMMKKWSEGQILGDFFQKGWDMLTHSFPSLLALETEQIRSKMASLTLRPAAVAYEELHKRARGFPFRLSRLLDAGDARLALAAETLQSPRCMRDPFTSKYLATFNTPALLCSEKSLQMLSLVMDLATCCTFDTERAHSSNLRRSLMKAGTHSIDMPELALHHAGFAGLKGFHPTTAKQSQQAKRPRGRPRKRRQPGSPDAGGKREEGKGNEQQEPTTKRRGGGGPWRLFLHEQMGARRWWRGDMSALSQAYNRLPAAEMARLRRIGAEGALLGCCGKQSWRDNAVNLLSEHVKNAILEKELQKARVTFSFCKQTLKACVCRKKKPCLRHLIQSYACILVWLPQAEVPPHMRLAAEHSQSMLEWHP